MLFQIRKIIAACICFLPFVAFADQPSNAQNDQAKLQQNIDLSQIETEAWLGLLDKRLYGESWARASLMFRNTVTKKEWTEAMDKLRKPFGAVQSRANADIRTAKDPKGLPAGDYMVYLYKTVFSGNKEAFELITLVQESDGQWRILTYQIN